MGSCFSSSSSDKPTAEITPTPHPTYIKAITAVKLYAPPNTILTSYIRFALLHKPGISLHFIPSQTPLNSDSPVIQVGSETVSGSQDTLMQYIESKFPNPILLGAVVACEDDYTMLSCGVVRLAVLQHRSVTWHLERMVRWVEDLRTCGGRKNVVDPCLGSPRMEVKKFGTSYSRLLELMVEHAQMEERIVFPILESADRGVCKGANEDHARQLPMMNGIKEEIKSIIVMDSDSRDYHEAMSNLSSRIKSLREHCKKQFGEEERNVLALMGAVDLSKEQEQRVFEQCVEVMQGTHSHLFGFLLKGLAPHEAMQYLDLMISKCENKERLASALSKVVDEFK